MAWANVNGPGDANICHYHPGAFWSGAYYVEDGGCATDPTLGGEFEMLDPRGRGARACMRRLLNSSARTDYRSAPPKRSAAPGTCCSCFRRGCFTRCGHIAAPAFAFRSPSISASET